MRSFVGRLSKGEEVFAERLTGQIKEEAPQGNPRWRGMLYLPIELRHLTRTDGPFQLDCDDGLIINVDLGDATLSNDSRWVVAEFFSHGIPLARPGA